MRCPGRAREACLERRGAGDVPFWRIELVCALWSERAVGMGGSGPDEGVQVRGMSL